MDVEILLKFVKPELIILIAVLWCIGFILKKAPWFKDEWVIPFVLVGIGIVLAILYLAIMMGEGFTKATFLMGFIQGIIVAAVAVLINETYKQAFIKRIEDKCKLRE